MTDSQAWVELALKTMSCTQKELAQQLCVSQTQISKWKNGEHMSSDMEKKFRTIVKIGDKQPEFVLWASSIEDAHKWERLIHLLAHQAEQNAETGYNTEPLQDEIELLCARIIGILSEMGVERPSAFPPELESYFNGSEGNDDDDLDADDQSWETIEANPYSALILKIFGSLNNIWGFYTAYVTKAIDDDDESLWDISMNIESGLMDLAACKVQVDEKFAPKFLAFKQGVLNDYPKWLTEVKDAAFRAGTPLRAELLDMIGEDAEELGQTAEAESLGFNSSRLHPDIYMNELLVGMRIIHQILPAILKKLDISDFELDQSALHINTRPPCATAYTRAEADAEA